MTRVAAILALALALALGGAVSGVRAGVPQRPSAAALEGEIVCPTCHTTLDESDAPIARRMKAYIRTRIDEGATAAQIKSELVAQFGHGVLATPPTKGFNLLAWVLPVGIAVLAAGVLGWLGWTWSRRGRAGETPDAEEQVDPELERRLDEELARFDT